MTLQNKRILITGATSGIGRCMAMKLAGMGAQLALCGRSDDKMDSLLAQIPSQGQKIVGIVFSVTEEKDIIDFVAFAQRELGGIDILINNAGLNSARAKVGDIKTEDFDYMVAVNFRAPFIFMREVFQVMKPLQKGTIINILSTVCLFSNEGNGTYTATKAGLDALTKVFRKEARKEGVKVCSVYPGGADTPFRSNDRPDYMSAESVADTIIAMLMLPGDVVMHDMVFRPMVEDNF
jgi:NAD(P)-dependent dehydrogenase (short-subunit alcohol dehydrogenase family)